ncbi:MAG: hypothetical protein L0Y57_12745 [Beijerinckiaceae bacterium]|nr:hypothetical protein [Beijerinckiaceae bacterium]
MSAKNFPACLAFTLKYEGGKSNDPRDPGGRTNQGVTQATYDKFRKYRGLPLCDVYDLPAAERDAIYREGYWVKVAGDALRDGEDLVVWDFAVNSGPKRALDIWRRCGASKAPVDDIIRNVCASRLSFLRALRTWAYFGKGWGKRVAACEALALKLAHGPAAKSILSNRAWEANREVDKKSTQAAIGASAAGTMAIIHGGTLMWIALAIMAALAGVYVFAAWRHAQRADALAASAKEIEAKQAASFAAALAAETAHKEVLAAPPGRK